MLEEVGFCEVQFHGWTGYRIGPHDMLVAMARRLNKAGVATLRFDLRGRGDSEGDDYATDLDMMIADTLQAAEALRDEARVGSAALLGICSGANVAIAAVTLDSRIDELILWSALPFQPEARARRGDHARRSRFNVGQYFAKLGRAETWRKFFRGRLNWGVIWRLLRGRAERGDHLDLKDSHRDLMAAFAGFRGRAIFINGDRDPDAVAAREVFMPFCREHGIAADFHSIAGANHSFYSLAWTEEVFSLSLDWYLRPTASARSAV